MRFRIPTVTAEDILNEILCKKKKQKLPAFDLLIILMRQRLGSNHKYHKFYFILVLFNPILLEEIYKKNRI